MSSSGTSGLFIAKSPATTFAVANEEGGNRFLKGSRSAMPAGDLTQLGIEARIRMIRDAPIELGDQVGDHVGVRWSKPMGLDRLEIDLSDATAQARMVYSIRVVDPSGYSARLGRGAWSVCGRECLKPLLLSLHQLQDPTAIDRAAQTIELEDKSRA